MSGWIPERRRHLATVGACACALALASALLAAPDARAADAREGQRESQPLRAPAPGDAGFVDMLVELGLGVEAGREAQRLMLAAGPDALPPETAFRVGMSLALAGQAAQAVPFLTQAAAASDDPRRADQWQLAAGVALLRARSFPHAFHLFARVEAFGADDETRARATLLRCIGHVQAHDGAAARACIRSLPPARRAGLGDPDVDDLLDDLDTSPKARAIAGGVLSAIVPGLGQLTGGEIADAGLALLVNGAWAAGAYFLLADGAIFEATLLIVAVGARYYLGNIGNGAQAWRAAAERKRARAAEELLRRLGRARP